MAIYDFDQPGIVLHAGDAFFLDTNFLVSVLYEGDVYHEVSQYFLHLLTFYRCKLYINSTVIAEAVNSLARILYVDDASYSYTLTHPQTASPFRSEEKATVLKRLRLDWQSILKHHPRMLAHYNKLAAIRVQLFIDACKILPANRVNLTLAVAHSHQIPLRSADAVILTEASGFGGTTPIKGMVTYDRDLITGALVVGLSLYKASQWNDRFLGRNSSGQVGHALRLIRKTPGLESFMRQAMGIDKHGRFEFDKKYR